MLSKDFVPIDIARLELRYRGVPTIVRSNRRAHAEAALGKIEAVADGVADAVVLNPPHQRLINAALINQILKQAANWISGKGSDYRGIHAEAALQSACHVVFAAALTHFKRSCR